MSRPTLPQSPPSPRSAARAGPDEFDVLAADFAAEARDPSSIAPAASAEIAFAGRSNVGKSTLLNMVCQRKSLARTSRTPGCTRGVVMFDLRFRSGASVRLVDLPGYGYAVRSKTERRAWGPLIEKYLMNRETLRGVVILVDARRGPEREEAELIEFLQSIGVPFVLVATKVDKLTRSERGIALDFIRKTYQAKVLGVSGETGDGRAALVREMLRLAADDDDSAPPPANEPG